MCTRCCPQILYRTTDRAHPGARVILSAVEPDPQEAFPARAERTSRHRLNATVLEQPCRQILGGSTKSLDVRKREVRALWKMTAETFYRVELLHGDLTSGSRPDEDGIDRRPTGTKHGGSTGLCVRGRTPDHTLMDRGDAFDQFGRADRPSDPPAPNMLKVFETLETVSVLSNMPGIEAIEMCRAPS